MVLSQLIDKIVITVHVNQVTRQHPVAVSFIKISSKSILNRYAVVWKGKGFKYFEIPRKVKSQDVSCWTRDLYDAPHNTSLSSAIPVPSHKTFHTSLHYAK